MKREKREARKARLSAKKNFTVRGEPVVAQARLTWGRVGPRKARLLADMIRDKPVGEALNSLTFTAKPSVQPLMVRLLKAAMAGVDRTQYNDDAINQLVVGEVKVDGAMMIKRFRPGPQGRISMIRHRTCHVTLRLTDPKGVGRPAGALPATATAAATQG